MSELEQVAPSEARQVLLRALDALDEAEREEGPARKTYLVVSWAHDFGERTACGWNATADPPFISVALLRETASAIERQVDRDGDE